MIGLMMAMDAAQIVRAQVRSMECDRRRQRRMAECAARAQAATDERLAELTAEYEALREIGLMLGTNG